MRTLTPTAPDPDDRDRNDDRPPATTWHWTPDQRTGTAPPGPRRTEAAALALAAHARALVLEPVDLPRAVPAVQLDAAPRALTPSPAMPARVDDEAGQATAEYALVLLGAAAIALLVISWATKTNVVGKLLDVIFSQLIGKATGR